MPAQGKAQNGLQIAFVGKLKDEGAARAHDPPQFSQGLGYIHQVMQDTHHDHRVERLILQRQTINIGAYKDKARIMAQPFLGLAQHRQRRLDQDHLRVAGVKIGEAAKTSPNFNQARAARREQRVQCAALSQVFEGTRVGPEFNSIGRTLIVAEGWWIGRPRRRSRLLFISMNGQSRNLTVVFYKLLKMFHVKH